MESFTNTLRLTRKLAFLTLFLTLTTGNTLAVPVGEDGLHKQEWFALTFKDIGEDIQEAEQITVNDWCWYLNSLDVPIALKRTRQCSQTLK